MKINNLSKVSFLICVFVLFIASESLSTTTIDQKLATQKEDLDKLKQTLEKENKVLLELSKTKTNVLNRIDQTEDQMRLISEYLVKLNSTSQTLLSAKLEKTTALAQAKKRVSQSESHIQNRMRSLYMKGKPERLVTFGIPQSGADFFKRLYFVRKLVEADRNMMREATNSRKALEGAVTSLKKKINEVKNFKKFKIQEISQYSIQMESLKDDIIKLQQDEYLKRQAVEEMENNALAMANIIKKLEEARKRMLEEARRKKLEAEKMRRLAERQNKIAPSQSGPRCKPVMGKIVSRFGTHYHERLKTSTQNLGIEYLASGGAKVKATLSGQVVYKGKIPGYQEGLIIVNPSGIYNIYGNLFGIQVKEGDKVNRCQELSITPKVSGERKRRVYFEVRKEKTPLDPVKWLKSKID